MIYATIGNATGALGGILAQGEPAQLLPSRMQMAFTLGFHIVLVPLGVALPLIILIAHYRGLRKHDQDALTLARRWSHAMGVLFAVGAVTGTVLSFEMGLLWPGLTGRWGDVFGLPFAIEGVMFFLEAILIAIYIYGWKRLKPWTHFWFAVPLPIIALVGSFSIISANAWMNQPAGFTLDAQGNPTDVDPIAAIFNDALGYELSHFVLAAYMCAGFIVASIYAVGMLKGRRDRYHRIGFLIPFAIAAVATPLQIFVGDYTARAIIDDQPTKFAAMELVYETGSDQPEVLFGRMDEETGEISGGISIPGLGSLLAGFSRDTVVTGLDSVPAEDRPPATIVHWAFDVMVGIGFLLLFVVAWFGFVWWRRRHLPKPRAFLWLASAAGVLAYVAMEAGWIVTEVGRQPWIVYEYTRTVDAVTDATGVWVSFVVVLVIYAAVATATILVLRAMSRRWQREDEIDDGAAPYGPRPRAPSPEAAEVTS